MRILVAITCLAVLATIGYFFWGEYKASVRLDAARQDAILRAQRKVAEKLGSDGRCTALAKAITDSQGRLSPDDLPDARICYQFGDLTAFERNSFELYREALN